MLPKAEKAKSKLSKEPKSKTQKKVQGESQHYKHTILQTLRERTYGQIIAQTQNAMNYLLSEEVQNEQWRSKIQSILFNFGKMPTASLRVLLRIYDLNRLVYYSRRATANREEVGQARFIYLLVRNLVKFYEELAYVQKQRVEQIYDKFEYWLKNREDPIHKSQMNVLLQISQLAWLASSRGQSRKIIQSSVLFLLKLPKIIGKGCTDKQEQGFNETYISITMKQMIKYAKKIQLMQVQMQNAILEFYYSSFQLLVQTAVNPHGDIPLFDIAALIFCSKHSQLFMKIINFTFCLFTTSLEQRKSQMLDNNEHRSYEQNESKIKATLVASAVLTFQSVFEDDHFEKKFSYHRQVLFLIILTFKQHLVKLIDQLEKIDKLSVHPSIIRGMFDIATFGSHIYDHKTLSKIVAKIRQTSELSSFLSIYESKAVKVENGANEGENKQGNDNMLKSIETTLFDLLYRIEKSLANYSLQIFMEQYIVHPLTFKREYFIESMFKNQHEEVMLKFMVGFTAKWLVPEQKTLDYKFDYQFYLLNFLTKCVREDKVDLIGRFIKSISLEEFIKINLSLYRLTFEEEKKKYGLPDSQNYQIQLAQIASVGFAQKFMLMDRMMPNFPEQLMWRQFTHHIFPSAHHILVKAFYHVVNYEYSDSELNWDKIKAIVARFETAIQQKLLEEVFSIFQLILCIFMKKNTSEIDRQLSKRVIKIVVENHALLLSLFGQIYESRRTAMNHMELTQEMVTDNLKSLERAKRMNSFFLRSILKFLQRIQNLHLLTDIGYEKMIEIILTISKDFEYTQCHSIRQLSDYSAEKYFPNMLITKVKQRLLNKERVSINHLLMLRELINVQIRRYPEQPQQHCNVSIHQREILGYYEFVLAAKTEVMNERDLLKSKLVVLESIFETKQFLLKSQDNAEYSEFGRYFRLSFDNCFKGIIIQIAQQNPEYVSRYQRELILHLRVVTITEIIRCHRTEYEIMDESTLHNFILELCFDKHIQMRCLLQNIMFSRFKCEGFKQFLSEKYHIIAFTTIMAIFDPHPALKQVAGKVVEAYKKAGEEDCSMGLTILLFCLKHLLTYLKNAISQEKYNINVDFFLKNFDRIWLVKKQCQFLAYSFACRFIQSKRIAFCVSDLEGEGYVQSYICAKQRTDFILQTEIKQYMKKEWEFSFEFPPEQTLPNSKEQCLNRIVLSLPYRIFAKLKLIIAQKSRSGRLIRHKKDLLIDWNWLSKRGILKFNEEAVDAGEIIGLSL